MTRAGGRASVALVTVVLATAVMPLLLVAALAVQVRADLGFTITQLGAVATAFFGSSALASPLAGRVVGRFGAAAGMRAVAVVGAASLTGLALARSWAQILVLVAVAGVGNAVAGPACNARIAAVVPPARLGLAFGASQVAIPGVALLGGLLVPVLALSVGWRWALAAGAVASAAVALLPMGGGRQQATEAAGRLTRRGPLLLLALAGALGMAEANALATFLVTGAVAAGFSAGQAGVVQAVAGLAGMTARVSVGALSDRLAGAHLTLMAAMLGVGALGFGLAATGSRPAYVLGVTIAFAFGWGWTTLLMLAYARAAPGAVAVASGIGLTGNYLGAVVGPLLFGLLAEHASLTAAWLTAAALALGAAVVALTARASLAGRPNLTLPPEGSAVPGLPVAARAELPPEGRAVPGLPVAVPTELPQDTRAAVLPAAGRSERS